MYKIEINNAKKLVHVTVSGFVAGDEAKAYLTEFQATARKVQASSYSLFVDGREQKTVATDIFEDMQQAVNLYSASGFKKVIIAFPSSSVATMQVKRLKGAEKITFVKTVEEAMAAI